MGVIDCGDDMVRMGFMAAELMVAIGNCGVLWDICSFSCLVVFFQGAPSSNYAGGRSTVILFISLAQTSELSRFRQNCRQMQTRCCNHYVADCDSKERIYSYRISQKVSNFP